MRSNIHKSNDHLIFVPLAVLFFLGSINLVGCGGTPARANIPQNMDELPPVDQMTLEKPLTTPVIINRGDVIEITYMADLNSFKTIGPVTFLGVEPETRMVGLLSETGEKLVLLSDAVQTVARIMDSGLSPRYEIGADHWRIKMPQPAAAPAKQ